MECIVLHHAGFVALKNPQCLAALWVLDSRQPVAYSPRALATNGGATSTALCWWAV